MTTTFDEKITYIDKVLGFYFENEPFIETARLFPSPEGQVENWFKFAQVFEKVSILGKVPTENWEVLQLIVEDAITEFEAAVFIGEKPDQERRLGEGYEESYEFPTGFVEHHQDLIWKVVNEVYRT